jgi:Holliday junction resolvasome RuvABC endonuclease subunit
VINPVLPTGKQVRQNSLDLQASQQLCAGALSAVKDAQIIFVEVPVGSQSARAMASYGICVGVLGALRASGIPFFEVTPNEVKLASVGSKVATKNEMIQWASNTHPEVQWPKAAAKAEHVADATAAIHAGLNTNEFKQLIPFF